MLFQSYATEAKDNNGSYYQTAFNFQPILKSSEKNDQVVQKRMFLKHQWFIGQV